MMLLGALAGGPVDRECRMGLRPAALGDRVLGSRVVARGEGRAHGAEDHDPHAVVGFGGEERFVQFDEQPPVLSVPGLRPVQQDADDAPSSWLSTIRYL